MATTDIGVGKSIAVLAVVVGCFTVLWPKIFYPMMQAAFSLTWPSHDEHGGDRSSSVSADPRRLRLQEAMGQARPADQSREYRKGRPFPHMSARQPPRQPTKTGGAMNLVMPLYTMGVVVFFLYTVLKLACKKPQESLQTDVAGPQGPDRYPQDLRLAYSSRQIPKSAGPGNWDGTVNSPAQPSDPEVEQLKKRLEDTEALLRQLLLQQARPPGMVGSPQLSPTVGQSLSLLVKELSKQCRQEEPHVETESPSRLAASSNRDQGGLRRRAHKTQRTCSCGAPLDMPPGTKDLQSDSDTSDWAKDSGDEDAATFMAANGKHYSECR